MTLVNTGFILQKFQNFSEAMSKFKLAEVTLLGTFHRFTIFPLPDFGDLHHHFKLLSKFVSESLHNLEPENIASIDTLLKDL